MKLRSKIHLYSTVLFAMLLLAASVTVYLVFSRLTIQRELDQLSGETIQAAEAIRKTSGEPALKELLRAYVPLNGMIRIVEEQGPGHGLMVTSSGETELSKLTAVYDSRKKTERITIDEKSYGAVSIPVIAADGSVINVQAVENMEELVQLLRILKIVLVFVSAIVLIPVIISSGVLGSVIMKPISAMTKTMQDIAGSGKFMRIKQEGRSKDELYAMGETFNEMIALLESNFTKQEQFVSNASHELKTPLTIIASYASLLKRRGMDRPDLFLESVEAIHSESQRMKDLTDQLLLLARPHQEWKLHFVQAELLPLAEQAAAAFRRAYGRTLELQAPDGLPIYAYTDVDKLKQLLFILLDNARKYSTETITIRIEPKGSRSLIQVIDRGIGIPEEDLPYVFDRFYRVDKSRSKGEEITGGSGLGLSLALEISKAIGAKLELMSIEGKGTTAEIQLPAERRADALSKETLI